MQRSAGQQDSDQLWREAKTNARLITHQIKLLVEPDESKKKSNPCGPLLNNQQCFDLQMSKSAQRYIMVPTIHILMLIPPTEQFLNTRAVRRRSGTETVLQHIVVQNVGHGTKEEAMLRCLNGGVIFCGMSKRSQTYKLGHRCLTVTPNHQINKYVPTGWAALGSKLEPDLKH